MSPEDALRLVEDLNALAAVDENEADRREDEQVWDRWARLRRRLVG